MEVTAPINCTGDRGSGRPNLAQAVRKLPVALEQAQSDLNSTLGISCRVS
ncbi:hypothetical protein [Nostoc sp. CMAA1605]|nr:hypothetical protein [Nostoc sp. CMAA1605]